MRALLIKDVNMAGVGTNESRTRASASSRARWMTASMSALANSALIAISVASTSHVGG